MNRKIVLIKVLFAFALCCSCTRQTTGKDNEADFGFCLTDDEKAVFIESYLGQQASVIIPHTIQDMPVTGIGHEAFCGVGRETRLTSVSIPDSVIAIERDAFSHNHLENVSIGSSVAFIGRDAFSYNRLSALSIPDSVIAIDSMAFMENRIASVSIPGNVAFIGAGAFLGNQLADIAISNGITHIGSMAFSMNRLSALAIPGSVTRIEPLAFEGNPLVQISIGADVELGEYDMAGNYAASFDHDFDGFYLAHGRKAGTYAYNNGAWSAEFR